MTLKQGIISGKKTKKKTFRNPFKTGYVRALQETPKCSLLFHPMLRKWEKSILK